MFPLLLLVGVGSVVGEAPSIIADGDTLTMMASAVFVDAGSGSVDLLTSIADLVKRVGDVEDAAAAADHSTAIAALQQTVGDIKAECASASEANEATIKTLRNRVTELEDAEKQRVAAEALEETEEAEQEQHFKELEASVEAAVTRIDEHDTKLASSAEDIETVAAEVGSELNSIESRLTWFLDDYLDGKDDLLSEMISQGDLEDADGNMAHMPGVERAFRTDLDFEDYFKLVELGEKERPDGKDHLGEQLKYAVKFMPGTDPDTGDALILQYRAERSAEHKKAHKLLCPGAYRFRIWLKYDEEYDGHIQFVHFRFFDATMDTGNGEWCNDGGFDCAAHAVDSRPSSNARLAGAGFWPSKAGEWKLVEVGFKLQTVSTNFHWYIGFPGKGTKGSVLFTGVSVTRLGGDGACEV